MEPRAASHGRAWWMMTIFKLILENLEKESMHFFHHQRYGRLNSYLSLKILKGLQPYWWTVFCKWQQTLIQWGGTRSRGSGPCASLAAWQRCGGVEQRTAPETPSGVLWIGKGRRRDHATVWRHPWGVGLEFGNPATRCRPPGGGSGHFGHLGQKWFKPMVFPKFIKKLCSGAIRMALFGQASPRKGEIQMAIPCRKWQGK